MKFNNQSIRTAVKEWLENSKEAEEKYGVLSSWNLDDVSSINEILSEIEFDSIIGYFHNAHITYEIDDGTCNEHEFDAIVFSINFYDKNKNILFHSNEKYFDLDWIEKTTNYFSRKDGYLIFDLIEKLWLRNRIFMKKSDLSKNNEKFRIIFDDDYINFTNACTGYFNGKNTMLLDYDSAFNEHHSFSNLNQLLNFLNDQKEINSSLIDSVEISKDKKRKNTKNLKKHILSFFGAKIDSFYFYYNYILGQGIDFDDINFDYDDNWVPKNDDQVEQIWGKIYDLIYDYFDPSNYFDTDGECWLYYENNKLLFKIKEEDPEDAVEFDFDKFQHVEKEFPEDYKPLLIKWEITDDGIFEIEE
tara:strand:- start:994 stop:2070 length:1077 start_codon:yes stop_codon:yes gene_type:complete